MFPIAGQTAGPIGLKFFVDTQGWPGGDIGYKKFQKVFFQKFFPRATPGPSASIIKYSYYYLSTTGWSNKHGNCETTFISDD